MKRTLFLFQFIAVFLLFSPISYSQLNWVWAKQGGSNGDRNCAFGITADAQGNSYVTGYVSPGSIVNGQPLTGIDSFDVFIAKYDKNGNQVWIRTAGGVRGDVGKCIKLDNNGHLYICGIFTNTATFGSIQVSTTNPSIRGFFVAKMDTAGNFIWVRPGYLGAIWPYHEDLFDLDLDTAGNIYYAFPAEGQQTIMPGITVGVNPYQFTIMVLKFDTNGNVVWTYFKPNNWQGGGVGRGLNIKIDGQGNTVLVNSCARGSVFNNTYMEFANLLIAKFNAAGQLVWQKEWGDTVLANWTCVPNSVEFDDDDNIYVGGIAKNKFEFDQNAQQGNHSGFLAKFDTAGNLVWARQMEDGVAQRTTAIRDIHYFKNSDSMYCAGNYWGPVDFDGIPLPASSTSRMFVARYDTTGSVGWVLTYGNSTFNTDQDIYDATFSDSAYLIAGRYTSTLSLPPIDLSMTGGSIVSNNFFVASARPGQSLGTQNILSASGLNFSVYPNPASTSVTVETEDKKRSYKVMVYSSTGQAVYEQGNVKGSVSINVDALASGNYFIQLNHEGQTLTKRFVVGH